MLLAGDRRVRLQRAAALLACLGLAVVAFGALGHTAAGAITVYRLGDWPAPFGIVLVLDRLAALMLALTAVVALAALVAAMTGPEPWDRRGRFFHALFQFQLMGLNGAFLTGDLFNLFVFFEVLLVASYCLLLHGRGPERLRAGFHYVAVNLAASALFLLAIAAALRGDRDAEPRRSRARGAAPRVAPTCRSPARRRWCCSSSSR